MAVVIVVVVMDKMVVAMAAVLWLLLSLLLWWWFEAAKRRSKWKARVDRQCWKCHDVDRSKGERTHESEHAIDPR